MVFPGLALLNLDGLTRHWYGHIDAQPQEFAEFLDDAQSRYYAGLGGWRERYGMRGNHARYYDGLRRLLGEGLNIRVWVELSFGRSYRCNVNSEVGKKQCEEP